jgi:hypothetical protein
MPPVLGRFRTCVAAAVMAISCGLVAAPASAVQQSYAGYSFFYFTGEGTANGEQIYLAPAGATTR